MTTAAPPGPAASPVMPKRPAEAVELCELLYRRIFSSGLIVVAIMAAYSAFLSTLRPEDNRVDALVVSLVLFVVAGSATLVRQSLYGRLRRHPWGIVVPALVVGAGAWAMGEPNDQAFYVITLTLGVTGLTVPFGHVLVATIVAGLGCTAPALLSATPHITSSAIAAVTIPTIFWLIIEQLARYVLRAYGESGDTAPDAADVGTGGPASGGDAASSGRSARHGAAHRAARRSPGLAWRVQRLLPRRSRSHERPVQLSARQLEVVLLAAEGLQDAEIGACLEIGEQQVRRHLRSAREKTGSATTYALMAWAVQHDLLPLDQRTGE